MAKILIVEADEQMRHDLMTFETPFELFVVESAQEAWKFVEAGLAFDDVVYFADPIAEALLHAAAAEHDSQLSAADLALIFDRPELERAA